MKLAVCMTSHNRRDFTIASIHRVLEAAEVAGLECRVFLVDADSTDGTAAVAESIGSAVHVYSATRDVYWAQGSRRALRAASGWSPELYLLLNDDTMLRVEALVSLLQDMHECRADLLVGVTIDPESGARTYGGMGGRPHRLTPLPITEAPIRCLTGNGNVMMLSAKAYRTTEGVSPEFVHGLGDFDLGLRATTQGLRVFQAKGVAGSCRRDALARTPISGMPAVRQALGVKATPLRPWFTYTRRHGGRAWLIRFLAPYVSAFVRRQRI